MKGRVPAEGRATGRHRSMEQIMIYKVSFISCELTNTAFSWREVKTQEDDDSIEH